jgi:hypothetical protein
MTDVEWVRKEISFWEQEEKDTLKRVAKAQKELTRAKAELAAAREWLIGSRGAKEEMLWQLDWFSKHGELP